MSQFGKKLFRWNRNLHRDIGYLCAVFTVIYGVSGVAVNHIEDWNANYKISRSEKSYETLPNFEDSQEIITFLNNLGIEEKFKSGYYSSEDYYKIFLQDSVVEVDLKAKKVIYEEVTKRPLLYSFNFLHLNHRKGFWTAIADIYGVCLIYLACSGLFMVKGRYGFRKRGVWLFLLGMVACLAGLIF